MALKLFIQVLLTQTTGFVRDNKTPKKRS